MAESIRVNRSVLGLIVTLLIQIAALLIWGSALNARVSFIQEQLVDIKSSMTTGTQQRYTTSDASRDKELYMRLFESNEKRISKLEEELKIHQ